MALGIITIIHAVLAIFLIIELGLMAYIVDTTSNAFVDTPSKFAFMLFNSVWSILVLLYLAVTPLYFARAYHGMVAFVILAITSIFWFAGSIAMAAFIGVPHCHGNNFCQCTQAAVAFGFFIWAIFTALTALEGLSSLRGGARADKTTSTV